MAAANISKVKGARGKASDGKKRHNVFARIALFIRQIFAELKEAQRSTRKEFGQMFLTIPVSMAVIMIAVDLFGLGLDRLTFWVLG